MKVAGCEWARSCVVQELAAAGVRATGAPTAILYYVLDTVGDSKDTGII